MNELEVLHDSNHVLCVVKPAGLPCVPDSSGDPSLLEVAKAWENRLIRVRGRKGFKEYMASRKIAVVATIIWNQVKTTASTPVQSPSAP